MDARAQNTSDSNSSLARVESKTARAGPDMRSTSKPSPMTRRMSRSLGAGFAVTKLPNKDTAQLPAFGCKSQYDPQSAGKPQTSRGRNSEARFELIPVGNMHTAGISPSAVNSGSTTKR